MLRFIERSSLTAIPRSQPRDRRQYLTSRRIQATRTRSYLDARPNCVQVFKFAPALWSRSSSFIESNHPCTGLSHLHHSHSDAQYNIVYISLSCAFTSAPCSRRTRASSTCPWKLLGSFLNVARIWKLRTINAFQYVCGLREVYVDFAHILLRHGAQGTNMSGTVHYAE